MQRSTMSRLVFSSLVGLGMLLLAVLPGAVSAQSFSLDDNPSGPITFAPPLPPFLSAEDPFGFGLPFIGLGPSPTLGAIGLTSGDILFPGGGLLPAPDVLSTYPPFYLDALSADHAAYRANSYTLHFSIDRNTSGVGGSASLGQFGLNQQPGDIYTTSSRFADPCFFSGALGGGPFAGVLPTAGVGGTNFLVWDESAFSLTAGLGPGVLIGPGGAAPPIGFGTHDNVDAYNDQPIAVLNGAGGPPAIHTFFSLSPAGGVLNGVSPADLFDLPAGAPLVVALPPYAPAPALGLDFFGGPNSDDVNALVVWNLAGNLGPAWGGPGPAPGFDCALFSLSPGSASLAALGFNPGTIFFTDFTGAFAVYAFAGDLGLASPLGPPSINVDALEVR